MPNDMDTAPRDGTFIVGGYLVQSMDGTVYSNATFITYWNAELGVWSAPEGDHYYSAVTGWVPLDKGPIPKTLYPEIVR